MENDVISLGNGGKWYSACTISRARMPYRGRPEMVKYYENDVRLQVRNYLHYKLEHSLIKHFLALQKRVFIM